MVEVEHTEVERRDRQAAVGTANAGKLGISIALTAVAVFAARLTIARARGFVEGRRCSGPAGAAGEHFVYPTENVTRE
jgi:hypothetical protein